MGVMHLTYESSLDNLTKINSSFDKGVLKIAYTKKNRNKSYISKEAFEKSLPTIYNVPVVCNYSREADDFGGHDIQLVKDNNGNYKLVNVTVPIGVVPESANTFWLEEDGREYLCSDVLIWKRQEGYEKLKENGITSESMEINVKDGYTNDAGIFVIENFEFTAFCLLGEDVEPCFENAALEMFSLQDMKSQFEQMFSEMKELYSTINTVISDDDKTNLTEGGEQVLNEKIELASKYGINVEELDFSLEDFSIEELTEKFEAMTTGQPETDPEPEPASEPEPVEPEQTFELNSNIEESVRTAVAGIESFNDGWGDYPRYCIADFDTESQRVYCFDRADDWKLYAFNYSMDGDNAVIDIDSKKRQKFAIVDFDEGSGEQNSPVVSAVEMFTVCLNSNTEWEAKYQAASDTIASMETELGELRQYKSNAEATAMQAKREELFAKFTDLDGVEAFDALREDCAELDIEILEEKCFAIRGRMVAVQAATFSLDEGKAPKLPVDHSNDDIEPYGGIVEKYLG